TPGRDLPAWWAPGCPDGRDRLVQAVGDDLELAEPRRSPRPTSEARSGSRSGAAAGAAATGAGCRGAEHEREQLLGRRRPVVPRGHGDGCRGASFPLPLAFEPPQCGDERLGIARVEEEGGIAADLAEDRDVAHDDRRAE